MKRPLIISMAMCLSFLSFSQWNGGTGPNNIDGLIERNGNVKANSLFFGKYGGSILGNTDPFAIFSDVISNEQDLLIFGNHDATLHLRVWDGHLKIGSGPNAIIHNDGSAFFHGKLGIATSNPLERLDIGIDSKINIKVGRWAALGVTGSAIATIIGNNAKASTTLDNTMEFMTTTVDGAKAIKMQYNEGISFHTHRGSVTSGQVFDGYERMRINNDGNILIGKTSQSNANYKLDVAGPVRANEIVVNTTGADYVFDEDYKLKTLSEVETYIQENGHLPDIPSAEEMQTNGMAVGELNTKLLEKIEELTLYVIELKKKTEEQDHLIKSLMQNSK